MISDLGAVDQNSFASLAAGMDVYLGSGPTTETMSRWLVAGNITQQRLDQAVSRALYARFLEGEFDPVDRVPYWNTTTYACSTIGQPLHRQIAYEAAVQSLVLLKNTAAALPLLSVKRLALVGPFAVNARWM